MKNVVHLCDCMEFMKSLPDNHYDLAIVDPPYGIGISLNPVRQMHEKKSWDHAIPGDDYFRELRRVSTHCFIWGGNYFPLPPSKGFVIWDKKQPMQFSLAMCEYAWTDVQKPAKMFRYKVDSEKNKIHPTQKPVALYKWLLANYAKPGDKIFDSHVGSGSIRIACHDLDFEFEGCEIDADYHAAQEARFVKHTDQLRLL